MATVIKLHTYRVVAAAAGHRHDAHMVELQVLVQAIFRPSPLVLGNTTSYPMGSGDTFPEVKQPEREADNSTPIGTRVNNTWIYLFTIHGQLYSYFYLPWKKSRFDHTGSIKFI
jgi:hypothetical protein